MGVQNRHGFYFMLQNIQIPKRHPTQFKKVTVEEALGVSGEQTRCQINVQRIRCLKGYVKHLQLIQEKTVAGSIHGLVMNSLMFVPHGTLGGNKQLLYLKIQIYFTQVRHYFHAWPSRTLPFSI